MAWKKPSKCMGSGLFYNENENRPSEKRFTITLEIHNKWNKYWIENSRCSNYLNFKKTVS